MASLRDVVAAESLGTKGMDEAAASRRFFAIVGAVVAKRASGVMYCGLTDRTVEFDEHGEVELLAGAALRGGATDFLSPEQLRNVKSTAASDVWALGVLLWHMLDGSLPAIPFGLQREMEPPFTNNIPHSPSLRRLLRACLMRNVKHRARLGAVAAWEWTVGEAGSAHPRAVQGPIMSPVRTLRSPTGNPGSSQGDGPLSGQGSRSGSSRGSRPPSARGIRPGPSRRNTAAVSRATYPLLHSPHLSAPHGSISPDHAPSRGFGYRDDQRPPTPLSPTKTHGHQHRGGDEYQMSQAWTEAHGAVQVAAHPVTGALLSPAQYGHYTAHPALHSPPRERRPDVAPFGPHKRRAFEALVAAVLHDKWRSQRTLLDDMTWAPHISVIDGVEYDVANLDYNELPERVQESNVMLARDACDAVISAVTDGRTIDSDFIEEAADEQHQQWVAENKAWAEPRLLAPYNELDEATKQKDRDVVIEAVRVLIEMVPRLAVAIPLPLAPARIIAERRRKHRKTLNGEADSPLGTDVLRSRRRSADYAAASRHQIDAPPPLSHRRSEDAQSRALHLERRSRLDERHADEMSRLTEQQVRIAKRLAEAVSERDAALAASEQWRVAASVASKGDARAQALLSSLHAAELSLKMQRVQLREIEAGAHAAASTAKSTQRKLSQHADQLRSELARARVAAGEMRERNKLAHNELASSAIESAVSQGVAQQAKKELFAARAAHASARAECAVRTARVESELAAEVALSAQYAEEARALKVDARADPTSAGLATASTGALAARGGRAHGGVAGESSGATVIALRGELAESEASVLRERAAVETLGARATVIVNMLDAKLTETNAAHKIAQAQNVAQIDSLTAQMARMKAEAERASRMAVESMARRQPSLSRPRMRTTSSLSSPRNSPCKSASREPSPHSSGSESRSGSNTNSMERLAAPTPTSPMPRPLPGTALLPRNAGHRLSVGQHVQRLEAQDKKNELHLITRGARAESPTLMLAQRDRHGGSPLRVKRRFKPKLSIDMGMCTP
jgi:hypothetical protein